MNKFLSGMKDATNFTFTENGAITHKTTNSDLLDMFAMGGAMRTRSDEDVILMFQKAYQENPVYALKCLFYLRDVRGGQGERRFFRVCMQWLAGIDSDAAHRNLKYIPEFGRWEDLYLFVNTPLETDAFAFMKAQLALDVQCKTPSLLAKWLKSENTSSSESRALGDKTRRYFGMTHKQYRKTLSILRERINVLERLMSAGEWDKIEYDKIPSKAGLIYKNAFARHDIERMKAGVQSYAEFAKDSSTTVNAKTLYPYEVVSKAMNFMGCDIWSNYHNRSLDDTDRLMINKYWDNLENYFQEASLNAMAVVDVSGSMCGSEASAPINVAISLGLYCAEKAKGPYAGHFMTFSSNPSLVKVEGVDFCDKVARMSHADWGGSTDIEACFNLMLDVAVRNNLSQDEIPDSLIIISDMEFNYCTTNLANWRRYAYGYTSTYDFDDSWPKTLMETMEERWKSHGYKMPALTFWNVQARQNNIPMTAKNGVQFVSGMSPSIFKMVMENKNAYDLMYSVLDSERYDCIK
jgi:hypothetical protein